ncbi:GFA family protein [Pseudobdellovibrio sp. HCB154]|uniref:GFA family protein n=1 Tax=Pseudobdellovibrio sp. HCB154 TaxID=3386277 RepID=UPI0039173CFB
MKYTGGCHCGKVKYEVEMNIDKPLSCNCSICQMKGTLLSFVPANEFKLLKGQDSLTDYQFNKKQIHHLFCSTCGVASFAIGTAPNGQEMRAINIRCLDGIDLDKFEVMKYDGRSI